MPKIEECIERIGSSIADIPLADYEEKYLIRLDDYDSFKNKYITENDATESDAQYVALCIQYGLKENPLFNDSLKQDQEYQSLLTQTERLKRELPDTVLSDSLDKYIYTKKMQSFNDISNKINPARWDAHKDTIEKRITAEYKFDKTIRDIKKVMNKRLSQLANGAKYK